MDLCVFEASLVYRSEFQDVYIVRLLSKQNEQQKMSYKTQYHEYTSTNKTPPPAKIQAIAQFACSCLGGHQMSFHRWTESRAVLSLFHKCVAVWACLLFSWVDSYVV